MGADGEVADDHGADHPRSSIARRQDASRRIAGHSTSLRQRGLGGQAAARGWQVTGVDFVSKALRRARVRAEGAGVELQLVEGDVTALADAGVGVGSGF